MKMMCSDLTSSRVIGAILLQQSSSREDSRQVETRQRKGGEHRQMQQRVAGNGTAQQRRPRTCNAPCGALTRQPLRYSFPGAVNDGAQDVEPAVEEMIRSRNH